jgi:hypothetical protein
LSLDQNEQANQNNWQFAEPPHPNQFHAETCGAQSAQDSQWQMQTHLQEWGIQ